MNKFGKPLIVIGIILVLVAFNMDTSVQSGYGRVNNIGLMSQQSNYLMLGGLIFLAGIIISVSTKSTGAVCPFCKEAINPAAVLCKHCGKEMTPQKESIGDSQTLRIPEENEKSKTVRIFRFLTLQNVAKALVALVTAILLSMLLDNRIIDITLVLHDDNFVDNWRRVEGNVINLLVIIIAVVGTLSNGYLRAASRIAGIYLSVIAVSILFKTFNDRLLPPDLLDLVVVGTLITIILLTGRLARKHKVATIPDE